MIILDTNVISELVRPEPNRRVVAWIAAQSALGLFTTSINEAEILFGVRVLPPGKRRNQLLEAAQAIFEVDFAERVLPFDSRSAGAFAEIAAKQKQLGRSISHADAQIAAITAVNGAKLATRNVSDFEQCNLKLINPFDK